ncbi:MAG: adenosylcobalamin-dependent ribonucleoside-diphosphate reductase [Deltaproteobacteria bacterium]|nr:adenosylcobalamin-dependent ribonucleoside-diphosphate reductase [Deltaproteobacteria bacterium]
MPAKISDNALVVLKGRYLKKDLEGNVIETPDEMFRRVARNLAQADRLYDPKADIPASEEEFYKIMSDLLFLPNSPTLMNAGRDLQQLAACFVLPVEDSLEDIFETVKNSALIHQSGGGTGFSFSRLRPKNDRVMSTKGVASGPVSFMKIFNMATDVIKQGGTRRGANMAVLRVDHPDIEEFIWIKRDQKELTNFNLSVAVTDRFMEGVESDSELELINPRDRTAVRRISARDLFNEIIEAAWESGEPGLLFLDRINRDNPTPKLGEIETTNPCGEQPLLPYEACNLGSINLAKMVRMGEVTSPIHYDIDWEKLEKTIRTSVRLLDNVIDMNRYPLPQTEAICKGNRKIGLGVMGFADMLVKMGISYDSEEALDTAERVMVFVKEKAWEASAGLASIRGTFPNFKGSIYDESGGPRLRNSTVTTVAPTGTLSIIADCSSGIEPLYALRYTRRVMDDIELGQHINMQAAFQKYTDNAVSKTINLPRLATKEDVREAYLLAFKTGCKGITLYRYGSREKQVLACKGIC